MNINIHGLCIFTRKEKIMDGKEWPSTQNCQAKCSIYCKRSSDTMKVSEMNVKEE